MNIIEIISDTFRRDYLGAYGNKWIRTPYLDRFARMSTTFDRAYICSFPTVPARYELLTGMVAFPTRGWEPMPRDQVTVAERLKEKGYVSMMILDTANLMRRGFFYAKGFDAFEWIRGQEGDEHSIDNVPVELGAPTSKLRHGWQHNIYQHRRSTFYRVQEREYFVARTMQTACDWLERNYRWDKFWLYVDTFDPHEPWDAPEWYLKLYEKSWKGDRLDYPRAGDTRKLYTKPEIKHIRALYAAEVTLVDKWVGRLFEKIEDLGLLENTVVIFTTDHGTQHGEHNLMMKGGGFYEETVHIPLMVYYPGAKARRPKALVQLQDVGATVMDVARALPREGIHGRSLLPVIEEGKGRVRQVAPSSSKLTPTGTAGSITDGTWELVTYPGRKPAELYHLPTDPGQKRNLIRKNRARASELFRAFMQFSEERGAAPEVLAPVEAARREVCG